MLFQSTLPRRERLIVAGNSILGVEDFNPRSREGSDEESVYSYHVSRISIHAPAKGATLSYAHDSIVSRISIHAPAKGATKGTTLPLTSKIYFNPRSREGSDEKD